MRTLWQTKLNKNLRAYENTFSFVCDKYARPDHIISELGMEPGNNTIIRRLRCKNIT